MTGFAQAQAQLATVAGAIGCVLTLKSVNHRFLDLSLRLPPGLESLAPGIERRIKAVLRRGHVDCALQLEQPLPAQYRLDPALAEAYRRAWQELSGKPPAAARRPDPEAMLAVPGMLAAGPPSGLREGEAANGALPRGVEEPLQAALAGLLRMREFEGAELRRELESRLGQLGAEVERIAARQPDLNAALRDRLRRRLLELANASVSEERLAQEAALLADRADISEEIARLRAHAQQFAATLAAGGEIGKKLEFLLQEMQREAGTLLAKISSASEPGLEITEAGLRIRLELEKLREQVQNLE